jgi:uncharacterized membrane protein
LTRKQIHWLGEFAQEAVLVGIAYLAFRLFEGGRYGPTLSMPLVLRIVVIVLVVAAAATFRTRRYYRRRGRHAGE